MAHARVLSWSSPARIEAALVRVLALALRETRNSSQASVGSHTHMHLQLMFEFSTYPEKTWSFGVAPGTEVDLRCALLYHFPPHVEHFGA